MGPLTINSPAEKEKHQKVVEKAVEFLHCKTKVGVPLLELLGINPAYLDQWNASQVDGAHRAVIRNFSPPLLAGCQVTLPRDFRTKVLLKLEDECDQLRAQISDPPTREALKERLSAHTSQRTDQQNQPTGIPDLRRAAFPPRTGTEIPSQCIPVSQEERNDTKLNSPTTSKMSPDSSIGKLVKITAFGSVAFVGAMHAYPKYRDDIRTYIPPEHLSLFDDIETTAYGTYRAIRSGAAYGTEALQSHIQPFERVDPPRIEVDDPSAPLVFNESTRKQTDARLNYFFKQVDSSFALKMCDSSINDLNATKAELETSMRNLPDGDLEELEYEFQIAFVNVELKKRYDALLSQDN